MAAALLFRLSDGGYLSVQRQAQGRAYDGNAVE